MLSKIFIAIVSIFVFSGFTCERTEKKIDYDRWVEMAKNQPFDDKKTMKHLSKIAESPHPMGSANQKLVGDYILNQIKNIGLKPLEDHFIAKVPNPILLDNRQAPVPLFLKKSGRNILAKSHEGDGCVVLVGSHYDSKYFRHFVYRGANDSGSSSALLIQLLSVAKGFADRGSRGLQCSLMAVWFDGEEAYLPNWQDGKLRHPAYTDDNTYGSRHIAQQLNKCGNGLCLPEKWGGNKVKSLILIDMVGEPGIKLTIDRNSSASLRKIASELDRLLNFAPLFSNTNIVDVEDDHIPFKQRGLPVINLIDFNHLNHWHKPGDNIDIISLDSIEKAYRLTLALFLAVSAIPQEQVFQ